MNQTKTPLQPSEQQRKIAKSIDEAFHTQLAKANQGLSPISLTLAYADWAMHLAVSPGRQMLLAQHALALSKQVLSSPLQQELAVDADGKPMREIDPRFSDASW